MQEVAVLAAPRPSLDGLDARLDTALPLPICHAGRQDLLDFQFGEATLPFSMPPSHQLFLLNERQIQTCAKVMGCKEQRASKIAVHFFSAIETPAPGYTAVFTLQDFLLCLASSLRRYHVNRPKMAQDIYQSFLLATQQKHLMILLGGTSGSGKSTVATLLSARLGIPTVLSTDSLRHLLRNFRSKEEEPALFTSTYECAKLTPPSACEGGPSDERKRLIKGYKRQCEAVQDYVLKVLAAYSARQESVIVEGVHLTGILMKVAMKQFPRSCLPFLLNIAKSEKHLNRFAVRSKLMTTDPTNNKYAKHFAEIRHIQSWLVKKAEQALVPIVENSNLDRGVGLLHATIGRCLRVLDSGAPLYDKARKQAAGLYEEYMVINRSKLRSKEVRSIIRAKVVDKVEQVKLFLQNGATYKPQEEEEEMVPVRPYESDPEPDMLRPESPKNIRPRSAREEEIGGKEGSGEKSPKKRDDDGQEYKSEEEPVMELTKRKKRSLALKRKKLLQFGIRIRREDEDQISPRSAGMGSLISGSLDLFHTNTAKTDNLSGEERLSEESAESCYSQKGDVGSDEGGPEVEEETDEDEDSEDEK